MRSASAAGFDLREAVDGLREAFAPGMGARGAGRTGRGDIRAAILVALSDEPMHGYQLIQAISARSGGMWKPSPGSIYPTLQLLSDEGLLSSEQVGERKVYSLTDAGRAAAAELTDAERPWQPRRAWDGDRAALPKAGAKLAQAIGQVATSGTREQTDRAAVILDETRRKLYALLAED
ncbi:MAG: PadR family transcriptional regulator [Micrococcales bacterium]|nr:PadR family transcriptional regulator [Micrococcales bacterium]